MRRTLAVLAGCAGLITATSGLLGGANAVAAPSARQFQTTRSTELHASKDRAPLLTPSVHVGVARTGVAAAAEPAAATQRIRMVREMLARLPGSAPSASATRIAGATEVTSHRPHVSEFPGQGDCNSQFCWTPGEPVIAVGMTDIVETVNTTATVYDKATGTQLAFIDFATFWGVANDTCVDPRALYVPGADRFAISCTDTLTGAVRFAVSKTNDPTGSWWQYSDGTTFLDQDKIVATSDKFIIAGNTSSLEQMYVYNLSDVLNGVATPTVASVTAVDSNIYEAAVEQTLTSDAYFVSTYPGESTWLATVTGTPAAGDVAVSEIVLAGPSYPAPKEPQVPGGSIGGGDLDGRVYDAVYEVETSDSRPVIEYATAGECGTQTCIVDARLDLSGPSPVEAYDTLIGQSGWDYSYGGVGLNAAGTAVESYTRSNTTTPPEAAVWGPGFDTVIQASTAGTTSCPSGQSPPCDERWGDYVSAAIDPSDPSAVWVSGLFQDTSGGFGWGTVVQKVIPSTGVSPTVDTGSASAVAGMSATVNGVANPNGLSTNAWFEYGTTTSYGSQTPTQAIGSGSGPVALSAPLTNLLPGTTYHFRLDASNSVGTTEGADGTFSTPPLPQVTTSRATSITGYAATLNGTINPEGQATTWSFQWGLSTSYGNTTGGGTVPAGSPASVSHGITGLQPGTTYHFRVVATNPSGTTDGGDVTFRTLALPGATTSPATAVTASTATIHGVVRPAGQATTWVFQWGLTTSYGNTTAGGSLGANVSSQNVSDPLSALTPGTTYHYRVVATNGTGTTDGADKTFSTLPPPQAVTEAASSIVTGSAVLNGKVNPKGSATTYDFEWGTTTAYGNTTTTHSVGAGTTSLAESVPISGLVPATTYHFRIVATNPSGTTDGADAMFTTIGPPSVVTKRATVSGTSATLSGTANPHGVAATAWFEWGTTTSYGNATARTAVGSGTTPASLTATLSGLAPGTYHYRIDAQSSGGTSLGTDVTFTIH